MKTGFKNRCISALLACCVVMLVAGCSGVLDFRSVSLEYYNLSEKVINVVDISNMPAVAGSGMLPPYPGGEENPRIRAGQILEGPFLIPDKFTIVWLEGGTSAGTGAPHQVEIRRDDFGIPSSISGQAIRFSYLGNNKWRLRVTKRSSES